MSIRKKISWVLWPVTMWYAVVVVLRNLLFELGIIKQTISPVTTIGIGNIAAGGTGKTPMTDYLLGLFSERFATAVVSRGYKRKSKGCVVTTDGQASVAEVGDEVAMLLAKHPNVPAAVCKKRTVAIDHLMATENPPQLVILDDVYQHRFLKPTINVLLTEYNRLYSDDYILPFGNLREPRTASRRANVIVVTKSPRRLNLLEKHLIAERLKVQCYQKLFFSYIEYGEPVALLDAPDVLLADVRHALCVTGIANPSPLIDELRAHGIKVDHLAFGDHHNFSGRDVAEIAKRFEALSSPSKIIITTEKDAARLRDLVVGLPVYYLPMSIGFHDENGKNFPDYITSMVKENISFLTRLNEGCKC